MKTIKDHKVAQLVNEISKSVKEACTGYPRCIRAIISKIVVNRLDEYQQEMDYLRHRNKVLEGLVNAQDDELRAQLSDAMDKIQWMLYGYHPNGFGNCWENAEALLNRTPKQSLDLIKNQYIAKYTRLAVNYIKNDFTLESCEDLIKYIEGLEK